MSEILPKVVVNDEQPFSTTQPDAIALHEAASRSKEIPHVSLASAPLNPRDRPRSNIQRIGVYTEEDRVGAFNLVQTAERSWINDIRIHERTGEGLGVAAYVGAAALLHTVGRKLESDPGGLSEDSERVWQSLARRGLATPVEGEFDQHGHARFVSTRPESEA